MFGPKSPGDSIDVHMWSLIDVLIDLWKNVVQMYDKFTCRNVYSMSSCYADN